MKVDLTAPIGGLDAVEFWDITNRQDGGICESVQNGMRSRVHHHGY